MTVYDIESDSPQTRAIAVAGGTPAEDRLHRADRNTGEISDGEVRQQLGRILNSAAFGNSIRLSRFLAYIVTKTLSGNRDDVRECSIGMDVFDRGDSFDPRMDSVVRVEARRLRRMLGDYYRGEGCRDRILIDVPKGSYVPVISRREAGAGAQSSPDAAAHAIPCIAVLPFTDLSPDRDLEHLCAAMSEQLTDLLTAVEGIKTVSATSCSALRRGSWDVREIGRKLRAHWLVQGSLRKSGEALRVSVRLSSCETGFQLWAASYDHPAAGVFQVQDKIGAAVVEALKPCVGIKEPARRTVLTENAEAYEGYLHGRFHYAKQNRPGLTKAIACFQRAICADPGFAAAHAALSRCYRQAALMGLATAAQAMPAARAAALCALGLEPSSGEALSALASVLATFDLDWDAAEARFEQALDSTPVTNLTRHAYALFFLIPQRRFEEALRQLELVKESDPFSPLNGAARSWTHFLAGSIDGAIAQAESLLELNETCVMGQLALGWALAEAGRRAESIEVLEQAKAITGSSSIILGSLGLVYGRAGRERDARNILQQTVLRPYDAALVHTGVGELDAAVAALEGAMSERCPRQVWIGVDPRFAALRSDARYAELLRKLGLPQPVASKGHAAAANATMQGLSSVRHQQQQASRAAQGTLLWQDSAVLARNSDEGTLR